MAEEYPRAHITGIDLSAIQPPWKPSNCYFEVDDFESDWEYITPFDFIFCRNIAGSVRDFPLLLSRAKENLNKDGWIELVDFVPRIWSDDNTIERAPETRRWAKLLRVASNRFGKDLDLVPHYKNFLREAGFKNVREETFKVPINTWPKDPRLKEIGLCQMHNMLEGLESYGMAPLTRVMGWTCQDVQDLVSKARVEMQDRSIHLYCKFVFVYGQKE
ncbi:Methyltransferase [Aspergillus sclerotialis]|uniref:Methyltransferase n=1 Tax=Aspergillus sclerotialis TaxID=2070753 RepID=A0A3A2ZZV7_9EURO|nr:Methyltransferase [Aspergillus sclerotialis]